MKILVTGCLAFFSLFIIGCSTSANTHSTSKRISEAQSPEKESLFTISGIILAKRIQGGDGSIWQFKGDNGILYSLVASIPNLGQSESKNINYVKLNAKLTITGEMYKLGSEYNLIARKITQTR